MLTLQFLSTGAVRCYVENDNGANSNVTTTNVGANKMWHACGAMMVTSTSRFAMLDGVMSAEGTAARSGPTVIAKENIGITWKATSPALPALGPVALPTIWNCALTPREWADLAMGRDPATVRPQSIMRGWWNDKPGMHNYDYAKFKRHLTTTGTLTATVGPSIYRDTAFTRQMPRALKAPAAAAAGQPMWKRLGGVRHSGFERQHGRMGF
jgi:hypothetical protein